MAKKRKPVAQNDTVKQSACNAGSFTQRHASLIAAYGVFFSFLGVLIGVVGLPQIQIWMPNPRSENISGTAGAVLLASKETDKPAPVEAKVPSGYTPGWDNTTGGNYPAKVRYNDGEVGSPAYDTGTTYPGNAGSRKSSRIKGRPHGALRSDAKLS